MTEAATPGLEQRALVQQGYLGYSNAELARLTWALRFTPALCMTLALVGLATQNPWVHFFLAVMGALALALPAHHPFDLFYNHVLRHLAGGPNLPPNPLPRRIACLAGGAMNLGIGLSFLAGRPLPGYILGALLVALQLIVISSHFCVASWLLELTASLRGRRLDRISREDAHRLVSEGALLVDVRSPREYGRGHLPDAVNIPIDMVEARQEELRRLDRSLITYCSAGARSHKAAQILRRAGLRDVHDLGSMKSW